MEDDYLRNLRVGNWDYESETSSFGPSDVRHPWEDEVNSQGELFYVIHRPPSQSTTEPCLENVFANEDNIQKNATGFIGRLMRRRGSRRSLRRNNGDKTAQGSAASACGIEHLFDKKLEDFEPINVYIKIDFANMKIIGRRSTAVETFLGMRVTFHGSRVFITDIIPNSPAFNMATFRKGDWLHSINGIMMTPENYLRNISFSKEVKEVVITVNRLKPLEKNEPSSSSALLDVEDYVMEGFSVLYLRLTKNAEIVSSDDVLFSYPSVERNLLSPVKGAFLTLLHLLPSLNAHQPISTTLTVKEMVINVLYTKKTDGLLLLAMPQSRISLKELYWVNADVVRCLHFTFQSLTRCFSSERNCNSLKKFFHALFKRVIHRSLDSTEYTYQFEAVLPTVPSLPLPQDLYTNNHTLDADWTTLLYKLPHPDLNPINRATSSYTIQYTLMLENGIFMSKALANSTRNTVSDDGDQSKMQVDDALNELEANDIEGFEDQKLFSIIGSCYFYKGYNVCSHLSREELLDVSSLCRQSDLSALMQRGVGELVFWQEVFPSHRPPPLSVGVARPALSVLSYLLIVAQDHHFLFVILESGGFTIRPLQNPGPDVAYVEEAVDTLKHIIKIGISNIANTMMKETEERGSKAALNSSSSSSEPSPGLTPSRSEPSLSKHHSLSYHSLDDYRMARSRSNINVIAPSGYDSLSSSGGDGGGGGREDWLVTPVTPPQVLGRRALRELLAQDSTSRAVSDFSDEPTDSTKDIKSKIEGENEELSFPPKITSGEKDVMLHYVHMDKGSGILISSIDNSKENASILNNFRFYAHEIHKILMNTVSFRKLKTPEVSTSVINKSMIAIKEHGILFEYAEDKVSPQTYWVVGRLLFSPQLREVYLCYRDGCPQNIVEVAFRLAINCPV